MNPEVIQAAKEALAQHERATPGPWTTDAREKWVDFWRIFGADHSKLFDEPHASSQSGPWSTADSTLEDIDWVIAARSREPLLARALLDADAEIERLNAVLRHTHATYCTEAWTDRGLHAPECLEVEIALTPAPLAPVRDGG